MRDQQRNRVVLTLGFARSWTVPGEAVTGRITARYHWGAPVAERMVEVTLPGEMTLKLVTDAEGNASFDYDTGMLAPGSIASFSVGMPSESSNETREFLDIDPLGYSIEADVSHGTIAAGEEFEIIAKTLLPDASATSKELTLEVIQQLSVKADPILGSLRDPRAATNHLERPLDGDEIARSVVDDGETRHRVPFVDGTPCRRGSNEAAPRRAMPYALNAASAMWWSFLP